jgi:ferredoxin-thioredoxin reductase catalytic chain
VSFHGERFRVSSRRVGKRASRDPRRFPSSRASTDIFSVLVSRASSRNAASAKNLEVMRKFSEQYAKGSDTYFCMDKSVTAVVIQGLAEHKDTLGAPLCPCRHYDDKEAEVQSGFWNCPCVPMRERKECHCMLFLTEDNDFAGDERNITIEEVVELSEGM